MSIEFLVHAWDFARATGQQVSVSDDVAGYVLQIAHANITPEIRSGGGFAGAIPVGPDAAPAGPADRLYRPRRVAGRAA